jgi:hypothetical protein
MNLRAYDPARDREACHRIWQEVGWLEAGKEPAMDLYVTGGKAWVADVYDEAECLVLTMPGTVRYLDEDLSLSCITGVTTSRVARKQGLAGRLLAKAIAADAAEGALVSSLGAFELGFYDRLGYGTGCYENWIAFDPALLQVPVKARPPRRIGTGDWEAAHKARLSRWRRHGACNVLPTALSQADMQWSTDGFGLGYRDESTGEITHCVWCTAEKVESGPYHIPWLAYRNGDEFLELMALLKGLGDQVHVMNMAEPPGIQFQDLMAQPNKMRTVTRQSKFEIHNHAAAYHQWRICDLAGCLDRTSLRCDGVRFNLRLNDPIVSFLEDSAPWRGVTGDYVTTLGRQSGAERGTDSTLPTLTASVGAFTRLWLGVLPATGLAITDDLSGTRELLEELDWALRLPQPKANWEF